MEFPFFILGAQPLSFSRPSHPLSTSRPKKRDAPIGAM